VTKYRVVVVDDVVDVVDVVVVGGGVGSVIVVFSAVFKAFVVI